MIILGTEFQEVLVEWPRGLLVKVTMKCNKAQQMLSPECMSIWKKLEETFAGNY